MPLNQAPTFISMGSISRVETTFTRNTTSFGVIYSLSSYILRHKPPVVLQRRWPYLSMEGDLLSYSALKCLRSNNNLIRASTRRCFWMIPCNGLPRPQHPIDPLYLFLIPKHDHSPREFKFQDWMCHVIYASASCVGAPRALCCWRWRLNIFWQPYVSSLHNEKCKITLPITLIHLRHINKHWKGQWLSLLMTYSGTGTFPVLGSRTRAGAGAGN